MIKKILFLLLIPTICSAEGLWGTRYNSWTRTNDYYKNSVSSSSFASNASTAAYSLNSNKLNGHTYDYYLDTTTAFNTYLSTGVSQIIAGSNITISPSLGKGDVTINAIVPPGQSYWVKNATDSLNMGNYGIYNSSYVYISTASGQGYFQISDKYIIVSGTMSAHIQNAINALGVGGGTVELLASTYTINSQINIFKSNVTIIGNGNGTILQANAWANWIAPGHVFYSSGTSNITISNMHIDGLAANTGQTKDAVRVETCSYVTLTYLNVDYSDNHGIYISGNFVFADHNTITNCDVSGIYLYGYSDALGTYSQGYNNICSINNIRLCPQGITVQYCRIPAIKNNYIWGSTSWGIQADQLNYGIDIIGNDVFGGTGGGIFFYGTTTQGFNCAANTISCANIGMLVQGDISAGSISNNVIIITGTANGIEIGSYNNVKNINIISNVISGIGTNKAAINAFDMSTSLISFNNCSNAASASSNAFLLQKGTGNVIVANLATNHTTDYWLAPFTYDNKLILNTANDPIKLIDSGRQSCVLSYQDCKYGFGVSSPTATVDVAGRVKVDNIWHVVGGTFTINTVIPGTKDNWSKITNTSGNLFQGTEVDGFTMTSDSMVVTNAGDYWGSVMVSYSANNGNDWSFRIKNIDTSAVTMLVEGASTTGSTNVVSITMPVYLDAAAGNRFILEAMNTSTDDDITIHSAKFTLVYLHD